MSNWLEQDFGSVDPQALLLLLAAAVSRLAEPPLQCPDHGLEALAAPPGPERAAPVLLSPPTPRARLTSNSSAPQLLCH
ncbi:unnamed protein product [Boreogadus saida]